MIIIHKLAAMFKDKFDFLKSEEPARDRARQKVKLLQRLQSAGDFQQVLQRERDCAEQTGQEFSLLVFELGDGSASYELAQKLWQVIYRRVRFSDAVGWLSNQSLGVILPNTPFAGGHKLAEDICRLCDVSPTSVSFKIYTYQGEERKAKGEER
jgi:hypothetical protein